MKTKPNTSLHSDINIDGKTYFLPNDWEEYLYDWVKAQDTTNDLEEFSRNDSNSDAARSCYIRHKAISNKYESYWRPFQWNNNKSIWSKYYSGIWSNILKDLNDEFFSLLADNNPVKALELIPDIKNEALYCSQLAKLIYSDRHKNLFI
jgi:hypothetical protein